MTITKCYFYSLFFLLALIGCQQTPTTDVSTLALRSETGGIQAVIEIPAGSNHKIEFDKASGTFENDLIDGKERIIDFLPYPGNYGFIPSTLMDEARGGDGDALDVLVIAEQLTTGSVIDIIPIATLQLLDQGEIDTKIIAIPRDSSLRIIHATNFEEFYITYNSAATIIKDWFLNYKGLGIMEMKGWQNEGFALREIEKWSISTVEE